MVEGEIPIGSYFYRKRLKSGSLRPTVVEVYLIRATKQRTKWLEKGERRVAWVSIAEAQERLASQRLRRYSSVSLKLSQLWSSAGGASFDDFLFFLIDNQGCN